MEMLIWASWSRIPSRVRGEMVFHLQALRAVILDETERLMENFIPRPSEE